MGRIVKVNSQHTHTCTKYLFNYCFFAIKRLRYLYHHRHDKPHRSVRLSQCRIELKRMRYPAISVCNYRRFSVCSFICLSIEFLSTIPLLVFRDSFCFAWSHVRVNVGWGNVRYIVGLQSSKLSFNGLTTVLCCVLGGGILAN